MEENPAARDLVVRLMDGYLDTQLLYVAARLGVADVLAERARSATELGELIGTDAPSLYRVLRGLVSMGILDEDAAGRFVLTDAGRCLESGRGDSVRGAVIARGELYYRAAGSLLETLRHGGSAFRHANGVDFFDAMAANSTSGAAFQSSMTSRSHREAAALVAAYDFSPFTHVVDVGGGRGVVLAAILNAHPRLRGTLFDRPDVVDRASEILARAGIDGRYEIVGGDFFANVPEAGDLYLLSRVIHDWDDAAAVRILTTCRRAMPAGRRLVLEEAVLPDRARDLPGVIRMDIHMLMLTNGRERRVAEFERLLAASGFTFQGAMVLDERDGLHALEAEAT